MASDEAKKIIYQGVFKQFTPEEQDVILRFFILCNQIEKTGDMIFEAFDKAKQNNQM